MNGDDQPSVLRPPIPIRLLNWFGHPLSRSLSPITEASILRWAERKTGLSDWGDESFRPFFEACVQSVSENPGLTTAGRLSARHFLRWHAANRLRLVDLVNQHPQIREIPVERPTFVTGLFRTGTTFLHNLLGSAPDVRVPLTWELSFPVPVHDDWETDRATRHRRARRMYRVNHWLVPEQSSAHHIDEDTPEEDFFLLENHFVSSTIFNTLGGYEYAYWLLEQDVRSAYDFLRLQLQVLAWQNPEYDPSTRWVLKCPYHLWHLDALTAAFPDACLIHTHRDVRKAIPSVCNLTAITSSKFARSLDFAAIGEFWQDFGARGIERAYAVRDTLPSDQVIDVHLKDLSKRPLQTVLAIYEQFGFEPPDGVEQALEGQLERRVHDRHGPHHYTLADYGLDPNTLLERFAVYVERAQLPTS